MAEETERAEPPGARSPFPPADARRRIVARLIDLAVPVCALMAAPEGQRRPIALGAGALLLCSDALFGSGRSLGKRLCSLRIVTVPQGRPPAMRNALLRNVLFAVSMLPAVASPAPVARWLALAALGVALAVEAAYALRPLLRELGQRRIGDLLAGTQVIDSRIALPLATPAMVRRPERLVAAPPVRHEHKRPQAAKKPQAEPHRSEEPACA